MKPHEHFKKAEDLIGTVEADRARLRGNITMAIRADHEVMIGLAQAHATLATVKEQDNE